MPCVFCGDPKTTDEHVWPKWVRRTVKDVPESLPHLQRGDSFGERSFPARAFNVIVNRVCASCNNGWMSELETRAQPLLTPILQGRGRELHRDGQLTLAAWAMKTAAMLEYTHPKALTISQEERNWLRERGEPPPHTQIWLGMYGGRLLNTWYKHDRFDGPPLGPFPYGITFLMGRVVFQLWGRGESGRILETKGPLARRLQQIYPYAGSITVRPSAALDDRLLKDASRSLRRPGKRDLRGWKFGLQRGA